MATTLILGGDSSSKLALTMAKLLSVGEKVCLVGGSQQTLEVMLREAVEKEIPFQFLDDLRDQEKMLENRLSRVRFCQRASEADSNIRAIIATQINLGHLPSYHSSTPIATLAADALTSNQITVRLYQPIEQTRCAQVLVNKQTDPSALQSIRNLLKTIGIDEITSEQADTVDRMLHAAGKPTLDEVIRAILPSRIPVDLTSTVMH